MQFKFLDIIMDPEDLVGEEGGEEMEVAEQEGVVAMPEAGPGALETLIAGVFEKVAVGVFTSVVQAEVKEVLVRQLYYKG